MKKKLLSRNTASTVRGTYASGVAGRLHDLFPKGEAAELEIPLSPAHGLSSALGLRNDSDRGSEIYRRRGRRGYSDIRRAVIK